MSHFFHYCIYTLVYTISLLPLKVLYFFANILYVLGWKIIGYRKNIIIQNLTRSFPLLKYDEINHVANRYAMHLCNLIVEWIKSFSESKESLLSRISVRSKPLADMDKNSDIFLLVGHFGNWELLNIIPLFDSRPVFAVYKKQTSQVADFLSKKMRCRFGLNLIESKEAGRFILSNKTSSIYIFIADQSPALSSKQQFKFLNQQTLAFEGPERLARKKKAQIVYTEILFQKQGEYAISFKEIKSEHIIRSFFSNLEISIVKNPFYWLWSHRRWKHAAAILWALISSISLSQAQDIQIRGRLINANDNSAIKHATIVLYNSADSTYANGSVSDSAGCFRIAAAHGDYFLGINHINYQRYYKRIGYINQDTIISSLTIYPDKHRIDEVIVTGNIQSAIFRNEKSIYRVSDIASSKTGGTMNDILKTIPAVSIDFNETVLIHGTPARFFVDGREITSSELKAYAPTHIETIEIVSNPTAQYDANGLSGIIYLKTKQNIAEGVSGAANISGAHDIQNGSASLSYKHNKLTLGSTFSIWNNHQHGSIETLLNGNNTSNNVHADILNITANLSTEYRFDHKNTLSAYYQYIDFGYKSKDYSDYRTGKNTMGSITHQIATTYQHLFEKEGEMIKLDIYYNQTIPQTHSLLDYKKNLFFISNQNDNHSIVGTLDYYLPFTENANLAAGIKSNTRNIVINRTDDFTGIQKATKFTYHESIFAAYIQMSSRMSNFNIQFGLRSETNLANKVVGNRKWDIFPNISLEYTANQDNNLKFGYNSRINRPSSADINPFIMMIDPTSIFKGNSNLRPEYSHNFFADYISRYQGNEIKFSGFYRLTNNLITKTFETTSDGILYTPVNIPAVHFWGIDLSSNQKFGHILTIQPNIGYTFSYIPNGTANGFRKTGTLSAGLNIGITLPFEITIQASGKYNSGLLSTGTSSQSAIVQGLALGLPQCITDFSVNKTLLNKRMNISIRITDPFNVQKNGFKVYSGNSLRESIYHMQTRFVHLSMSYRFNNFTGSKQKYDDGGIKVF